MGKVKPILQVGGSIMSLIITASSLSLNVLNVNPEIPWNVISLIFFLVFVGLIGWTLYDKQRYIGNLLDTRPSISVKPITDINDDWYLEVTNKGGAGEFECQIKVLEDKTGYEKGKIYFGCWQLGVSSKAVIMNIDRVKIAHKKVTVFPPKSDPLVPFLMSLCLYYWEKLSAPPQCHYWESTAWSPNVNNAIEPRYLLNITITSVPPLKEGRFVKDYNLDFKGLTEIILQSNARKEGSQPP